MPDSATSDIGGKYAFNSSSLINLERRRRGLKVLDRLGDRIIVPWVVAKEVDKRGKPLQRWLAHNQKNVARFLPQESTFYLKLLQQRQPKIGSGEAAAISVALHRKCTLVIDDQTAMEKAKEHGVDCLRLDEFAARPLL